MMIWVCLKVITDNRATKKLENTKKKVPFHRNKYKEDADPSDALYIFFQVI